MKQSKVFRMAFMVGCSALLVGCLVLSLGYWYHRQSVQPAPTRVSGCGPEALAVVLQYKGHPVDAAELAMLAKADERGWTSLYGLAQASQAQGFEAMGYHLEMEELSDIPLPAVMHIHGNHFVALTEYRPPKVTIVDGGRTSQLAVSEFAQMWDGTALVLEEDTNGKGHSRDD